MHSSNDNNDEINSSQSILHWFDDNNSIEFSNSLNDDYSRVHFLPFNNISNDNSNEAPRTSRHFHILSSPRIPRLQPRYQLLERMSTRWWDNKLFQKKYGSFFLNFLQKMASKELIYINEPCNLYKKFFFIFYTQFKKSNKDILSQIIKCFPDLYSMRDFILGGDFNRKTSIKNVIFIKICLDILDAYYDKADSLILNQTYANDYLQLFILFYNSVTTRNLGTVINKIKDINSNFYVQYKRFVEFERDEFIQYYNKEEREKCNLYGGIEIKSDLFVQ